jgi:hypothetical protein
LTVHHIDFKVVWEDWTTYQLQNNIVLRVKNPIYRIVEQPQSGSGETYHIDFEVLHRIEGDIATHEPSQDQLIRPDDILEQVSFSPLDERVQIYYIQKYKDVLLLKPVVTKVSATTKYDLKGYPVFNIESSIMMTSVRLP